MTETGYARILLDKKDTQIMKLESEITKLRIEYESQIMKLLKKNKELEKENAELKKKNKWYSEQVCNKECAEVWGNLDKAKEIMNIAIEGIKYWGIVGGNERPLEKQAEMLFNLFLDKAEQFLKDSEKEC